MIRSRSGRIATSQRPPSTRPVPEERVGKAAADREGVGRQARHAENMVSDCPPEGPHQHHAGRDRKGSLQGADAVPPLGDGQGVALELALVAEGLSNQEIAERLVVSPWTAKTHVSRAMVKLGARDRAQLVAFAYESGLARPGWLD